MRPDPVPLDQVDLADLATFERNEAWGMFETLRAEAPCHWTEEHDGGKGFWAVTRYEDIEKVDKDTETFTSTKFTNLEEPPEEFQELRRSILESDGPRHLALRKLLMRDFTPAQLCRYEDFLRGLAALTVETALQQEEIDLKAIAKRAAQIAEKKVIERVLAQTRWNRKEAAERLQISYKALLYKMKENGLSDDR